MLTGRVPINVTKPYLPPLEDFLPYLEKIWDSRILSNGGPFHTQFEEELCKTLNVKHVSLFGNGTLALLVAFRALGLENAEIITTPYSFVATSSTLLWSRNIPVFVDIEPGSTNIDPLKIEQAITKDTKAILAVHCYGHPCKTEAIGAIAKKHGLKVIYDAAHAFGVETESGSVLNQGDLSILSFHATKVFNTFEGGAIVCHTPEMKARLDRLKNFGFVSEVQVEEVGINAKMNEFSAALGVLQLKHLKQSIEMRGRVDQCYRENLKSVDGIECLKNPAAQTKNFAYFPILVKDEYALSRDELYDLLKTKDIYARRYFFPLISDFPAYADFPSSRIDNLPVAASVARQILCLPLFSEMPLSVAETISEIIKSQGKSRS